mmetsp:Transcript_12662/g.29804  ORF Transcript_12662/g.29804 Transcript_12662/m.29804 type:complete len:227 (-) Transcript_12662:245-925(-)
MRSTRGFSEKKPEMPTAPSSTPPPLPRRSSTRRVAPCCCSSSIASPTRRLHRALNSRSLMYPTFCPPASTSLVCTGSFSSNVLVITSLRGSAPADLAMVTSTSLPSPWMASSASNDVMPFVSRELMFSTMSPKPMPTEAAAVPGAGTEPTFISPVSLMMRLSPTPVTSNLFSFAAPEGGSMREYLSPSLATSLSASSNARSSVIGSRLRSRWRSAGQFRPPNERSR